MTAPFDIVHVAYSPFPADPRVRREALLGAEMGLRVAVIALADGRDPVGVAEWEGLTVYRLEGKKRRGTIMQYVSEYGGFIRDARRLISRTDELRRARLGQAHSLPDFIIAALDPIRANGSPLILDLHEIFPEFAESKYAPPLGKVFGRVARELEAWSRRRASATITVTRSIEKLLGSRLAKPGERILVVHNVPDPRDFGPPAAYRQPETGGSTRLVYHGTVTHLYGLDLAIEGVRGAREAGIDVTFDVFGDGPQRRTLIERVASWGLESAIRFLDPVPAKELRARLPTYHAGLVPTRADIMTRHSLSTKLLEYVHLGIPVLAPSLVGYLEYFPAGALFYYRPNDSTAITGAIRDFVSTSPDVRAARVREAQAALAGLQWAEEKSKLRALYADLLKLG